MALHHISVGFRGGQVVSARLGAEQLEALYRMLGTDGWCALDTEDGPIRLNLAQIAYVHTDNEEHRVGFGA